MLRPLRERVGAWAPPAVPQLGDALGAVEAAWPALAGERVAASAWPHELRDGVLTVATRSSAWSHELQLLGPRILAGLAALRPDPGVRDLRFRTGLRRRRPRTHVAGAPAAAPRARLGSYPEPAPDLEAALGNVRRRIALARRSAAATCADCGAPVAREAARCAACVVSAARERDLAVERALFAAPWVGAASLEALVPGADAAAFEAARRRLLARWWEALQRALRSGRTSPDRYEQQVASSYVLLQSGLPPERMSPAVLANALGPELVALLWPERAAENQALAAKSQDR